MAKDETGGGENGPAEYSMSQLVFCTTWSEESWSCLGVFLAVVNFQAASLTPQPHYELFHL
jgi:hypothetical protein